MNRQKVERIKAEIEGLWIGYEKPSADLLKEIRHQIVKLIDALLEKNKEEEE